MITGINIKNFKAIDAVELQLGPINVLIGANNSGKTSAIHAIQFAVASAQSAALHAKKPYNDDEMSTTLGQDQLLWSPIHDAFQLAHGAPLTRALPIEVSFNDENGQIASVQLARGKNKNLTIKIVGEDVGRQLQSVDEPYCVYVPGLAGIAKNERFLSKGVVLRMVAQGDANLVFRNVLLLLGQDNEKWTSFLELFKSIFPHYDIKVAFDEETDEHINIYLVDPNGRYRSIDTSGTGMLQVIQVLAYAILYNPRLLLLDEPDSHLHPNNQRILCNVLVNLSQSTETQIVISSHSQHILHTLQDYAEFHWIQHGVLVAYNEVSRYPILADLGALGITDLIEGGAVRCLVLTEDERTTGISALLESAGFNMEETRIGSYKGCSNLYAARVLAEFVRSLTPDIQIVIHRDRDGLSDGEIDQYTLSLKEDNIHAFVTVGNDIESYFVRPEHVHRMYPQVSIDDCKSMIEDVYQELDKDSKKRIINIRSERNLKKDQNSRVDPGALAITAMEEYAENPHCFVNGKKALSLLKSKLQHALKQNVYLFQSSPDIVDQQLTQLVLEFWPEG
jgi:energy-coupling factor transporter ATP-binding protein EcfA2